MTEDEKLARWDMGLEERMKLARLECERDGLDPDAPYVDQFGRTTVCGPNGELFPNYEYYDLVITGHAPRPVKQGLVN